MKTERVNLSVNAGVGDMLTKLAGSDRKRGQYVSRLITAIYNNEESEPTELDDLKMAFRGMSATQKTLEKRVGKIENHLDI